MLLLVNNRTLTQNREKTYLTVNVAAAGTTLTVKAVDNTAWADNDWVLVGEIGNPNAEILQINGAVSDGTSLTVDNAGSGGARFAHAVDEPVYRLDFNQIQYARATTEDGSKTVLATNEVMPEDFQSRYDDQSNTTGYAFVRFKNSFTGGFSAYSDAIPYGGQTQSSLTRMIEKVRALTDEQNDDFISDAQITDALNDKQRDIINERLWTFDEIVRSASSIQYQFAYEQDTEIKTLHTVRFRTLPLANIGQARWEMLHWNTSQTSTTPTHVSIFGGKMQIYPQPEDSAGASQLNGAISSSATSITVDDGGEFERGDYFRFQIDSEIIYATYEASDVFSGCLRGQEGTTAASHLDNAVVTELDIVSTGQKAPVDLVQQNDETIIPEPITLCYGVAGDLCHGKLNKMELGDRWDKKYEEGIKSLRDKFTLKMTSQPGRIKDPSEVIFDNGKFLNPNNYPQNVTAS